MNSRTLANLLLLIILIVFAGYYLTTKNKTADIKRLTSLTLDEINTIRIPRENNLDIVLQKTSSEDNEITWQMLKPYAIKAHQFRINTLLSLTQTPIEDSYDSRTLTLSDYALDKPRARIVFNSTEIHFGKTNPLNNKRYLLSNDQLSLVNDQLYPLVSAQAATFVDLSLLHNNDIHSISLPDVKIHRLDNIHWESTSSKPTDKQLSADQIQSLLETWRNAQAFAVHRYLPRKKIGLIKITFKNSSIDFELSDNDPWLIIARPDLGIEYHLDKSLSHALLTPLLDVPETQGEIDAGTP